MSFSSMFGGGGSGSTGLGLGQDIISGYNAEEKRLYGEAAKFEDLAAKAGLDAKSLGQAAERKRIATISNPNPWITSGHGALGIADSRTLGASYILGT